MPPLEKSKAIKFDLHIYQKVWNEASIMRKTKKLLNLAKKITCPVIAIHGDYDPHPYKGVKEPLSKEIKNFKSVLLKNYGHHPWLEKMARDKFYLILQEELSFHSQKSCKF